MCIEQLVQRVLHAYGRDWHKQAEDQLERPQRCRVRQYFLNKVCTALLCHVNFTRC